MKKKNLSHSLPDIDFLTSVSTTECTGLVPRAPLDENELEESLDIMKFSPKSINNT